MKNFDVMDIPIVVRNIKDASAMAAPGARHDRILVTTLGQVTCRVLPALAEIDLCLDAKQLILVVSMLDRTLRYGQEKGSKVVW